jgi:hypothetical protein
LQLTTSFALLDRFVFRTIETVAAIAVTTDMSLSTPAFMTHNPNGDHLQHADPPISIPIINTRIYVAHRSNCVAEGTKQLASVGSPQARQMFIGAEARKVSKVVSRRSFQFWFSTARDRRSYSACLKTKS